MLSERVLRILRSVVPKPSPLHEPVFSDLESRYVQDCIASGIVSSIGPYVDRLEEALARQAGVKRAVSVVNGTAALQICLQLAGVRRDEEVIIPALTFVATANAVAHAGGIPHLADSSPDTLGLDPDALAAHLERVAEIREDGHAWNRETGRRIAACVPMHTFGHPVDMDPLSVLCGRYGIPVVEDAAESLGSSYKGRMTGSFGKLAALSFNGNKIITTGGGGAILTDDEELGSLAKHLTTTAKVPHRWEYFHDRVGYNYRMPNLNAALGCAQMEKLDSFLARKRALAERYAQAFAGEPGMRIFMEPANSRSNYWLNVLLLDPDRKGERDQVLEAAHGAGFMARPAWVLMHRLPMYASCPRMDLPVAEDLEARLVNLPSGAGLSPAP